MEMNPTSAEVMRQDSLIFLRKTGCKSRVPIVPPQGPFTAADDNGETGTNRRRRECLN